MIEVIKHIVFYLVFRVFQPMYIGCVLLLPGRRLAWIREAAIRYSGATTKNIWQALRLPGDENRTVRALAIQHPNVTLEHLDYVLRYGPQSLRRIAIDACGAVRANHIEYVLYYDNDYLVRILALDHPCVTFQHIEIALDDPDPMVKECAATHSLNNGVNRLLNRIEKPI